MRFPVSSNNTDLFQTPQIIDNVFAFPEIYFLERIADFDFLVFDHAAQVRDMGCWGFEWEVLLDLYTVSVCMAREQIPRDKVTLGAKGGREYLTSEVAGEVH